MGILCNNRAEIWNSLRQIPMNPRKRSLGNPVVGGNMWCFLRADARKKHHIYTHTPEIPNEAPKIIVPAGAIDDKIKPTFHKKVG